MIILSIRTDKPDAEIGLFDDEKQIEYEVWQAHRQLSVTIHTKIEEVLKRQSKSLHDVQGIVCFKGPGSFTGLRIGLAVANALAASLEVPIMSSNTEAWVQDGIKRLLRNEKEAVALPFYGAEAFVTQPKK